MTQHVFGQDLTKYHWENRIILVFGKDSEDEKYKKQLAILKKDLEGMKERKLLVYEVLPTQYRLAGENWKTSTALFDEYHEGDIDLSVILIGLDGGVKLRQSRLLELEQLFPLIDGMPMRRAEIKRKKDN